MKGGFACANRRFNVTGFVHGGLLKRICFTG